MKGARTAWIQVKDLDFDSGNLVDVEPNGDSYITFNEPHGYVREQYQKVAIIPLEDD